MARAKIKKGDEIIVITGQDKGRSGTVRKVLDNGRVIVDGVNVRKRHTKPNPQKNIQGGIVEKEVSIHGSNIAIYNAQTKKADRVGIKILEDGRRVRSFKSTNEVIDI